MLRPSRMQSPAAGPRAPTGDAGSSRQDPAVLDPRRRLRRDQARHEQPARTRRTRAGHVASPGSPPLRQVTRFLPGPQSGAVLTFVVDPAAWIRHARGRQTSPPTNLRRFGRGDRGAPPAAGIADRPGTPAHTRVTKIASIRSVGRSCTAHGGETRRPAQDDQRRRVRVPVPLPCPGYAPASRPVRSRPTGRIGVDPTPTVRELRRATGPGRRSAASSADSDTPRTVCPYRNRDQHRRQRIREETVAGEVYPNGAAGVVWPGRLGLVTGNCMSGKGTLSGGTSWVGGPNGVEFVGGPGGVPDRVCTSPAANAA